MLKIFAFVFVSFIAFSCSDLDKNVVVKKEFETDGLVTYEKDIKPIIVKNCGPCHIAGGNRNNMYDNYSKAKLLHDLILERIILPENNGAFMPFGGKKLTDTEIKLYKKWISDGLLF